MATFRHSATAAPTAERNEDLLDFYARPSPLTSAGRLGSLLTSLPGDLPDLTRALQGLSVHEFMASAYGITIPEDRKRESHIRGLEPLLAAILAQDARPLNVSRPPARRVVGVCNHFAVLLVGVLRSRGIPARARWGFGSYFNPPFFEDHVLGEYWHAAQDRWVRVDAQLDAAFRKEAEVDFDPLDVPRDRFIGSGDAWVRCRSGRADPGRFGTVNGNLRGLWFVAASVLKDTAALNKVELLPWDSWGAMPKPGAELDPEQLALFDRLAEWSRDPDTAFSELKSFYERDPRVRVPDMVYNALHARMEPVD